MAERRGPSPRRGARALAPRKGRRGFIYAYGLFWNADEVSWSPRGEHGQPFRLLGRHGKQRPSLQVCDFRDQRGIYVLHDDYGPYYVGLVRKGNLGNRLRTHHQRDRHAGKWQRFSWFGFCPVLAKTVYEDGTSALGPVPKELLTDSRSTIGDIEALLIQALGTQKRSNAMQMRFALGEPWEQIPPWDVEKYLGRVAAYVR